MVVPPHNANDSQCACHRLRNSSIVNPLAACLFLRNPQFSQVLGRGNRSFDPLTLCREIQRGNVSVVATLEPGFVYRVKHHRVLHSNKLPAAGQPFHALLEDSFEAGVGPFGGVVS